MIDKKDMEFDDLDLSVSYLELAEQCSLDVQEQINLIELENMARESRFIMEAMEYGIISGHDIAELQNHTVMTEGVLESIILFFQRIMDLFRSKSVARSKKYDPWYMDLQRHRRQLKSVYKDWKVLNVHPIWRGKWKTDIALMTKAVDTAYDNYQNGKYDDFKFAEPFCDPKSVAESSQTLSEELKNYFRYNAKGATAPEQVKVTADILDGMLNDMLEFNYQFHDKAGKSVNEVITNITKRIEEAADFDARDAAKKKAEAPKNNNESGNNNNPQGNQAETQSSTGNNDSGSNASGNAQPTDESFANYWLSVEQRPVCESIVVLAMNYQQLLEQEGQQSNQQQSGQDTPNGNPQIDQAEDNSNTNQNASSSNAENNEAAAKAAEEEKTKKEDYAKAVAKFTSTMTGAYTTAMEQRYDIYRKLLLQLTQGTEFKYYTNKKGEYIMIGERVKVSSGKAPKNKKSGQNNSNDNSGKSKKTVQQLAAEVKQSAGKTLKRFYNKKDNTAAANQNAGQ